MKAAETADVLTVTNGLWVKEAFRPLVRQEFEDTLTANYAAEVLSLPKADGQTAVNAWIKNATRGRIGKIVGEQLRAVL
jgi:serine protease inhibitor